MATNTDKLIQELSQLFAYNSYDADFIKDRLDNLAEIAKLEGQIEEHKIIRGEQKPIHPTYSLGEVGVIEPDQLNNNEDFQL